MLHIFSSELGRQGRCCLETLEVNIQLIHFCESIPKLLSSPQTSQTASCSDCSVFMTATKIDFRPEVLLLGPLWEKNVV